MTIVLSYDCIALLNEYTIGHCRKWNWLLYLLFIHNFTHLISLITNNERLQGKRLSIYIVLRSNGLHWITKQAGCIAIRWDETTIKKTLFEIRLHFHSDSFSQLAGKPIAFTSTLGWAFKNAFNCCLKSLSGWVAFCKYPKQQSWA